MHNSEQIAQKIAQKSEWRLVYHNLELPIESGETWFLGRVEYLIRPIERTTKQIIGDLSYFLNIQNPQRFCLSPTVESRLAVKSFF